MRGVRYEVEAGPQWKSIVPDFLGERLLIAGWIRRGADVYELASVMKLTKRNGVTLIAESIYMVVREMEGTACHFKGEALAASIVHAWPGAPIAVCLTEWHHEQRVGD